MEIDIPQGEKKIYRKKFGLPEEQFLYLMMYDKLSMTERKNPQAVLDAYKIAFGESGEKKKVGMVVKINNPTAQEIKMIKTIVPKEMNVHLITDILNRKQVNELIYCVDTVISLHRAEGFGLVLAEAMKIGTPTIATNWSSNTEFMNSEVACMVDADLIKIKEDIGDYKKGNCWAEPNIIQAADFMKRLYEDQAFGVEISKKARIFISEHLNSDRIVEKIQSRLQEIYKGDV